MCTLIPIVFRMQWSTQPLSPSTRCFCTLLLVLPLRVASVRCFWSCFCALLLYVAFGLLDSYLLYYILRKLVVVALHSSDRLLLDVVCSFSLASLIVRCACKFVLVHFFCLLVALAAVTRFVWLASYSSLCLQPWPA